MQEEKPNGAQLKQMTIDGSRAFREELREKLSLEKVTLLKETGISVTNKRLNVCAFLQEQEAYYTKILRELDLPHDSYHVSLLLVVKQEREDHQVPHKDSASKKIYWTVGLGPTHTTRFPLEGTNVSKSKDAASDYYLPTGDDHVYAWNGAQYHAGTAVVKGDWDKQVRVFLVIRPSATKDSNGGVYNPALTWTWKDSNLSRIISCAPRDLSSLKGTGSYINPYLISFAYYDKSA